MNLYMYMYTHIHVFCYIQTEGGADSAVRQVMINICS